MIISSRVNLPQVFTRNGDTKQNRWVSLFPISHAHVTFLSCLDSKTWHFEQESVLSVFLVSLEENNEDTEWNMCLLTVSPEKMGVNGTPRSLAALSLALAEGETNNWSANLNMFIWLFHRKSGSVSETACSRDNKTEGLMRVYTTLHHLPTTSTMPCCFVPV